ncbi:unnamed protein product [Caenorhabditis nigoni]
MSRSENRNFVINHRFDNVGQMTSDLVHDKQSYSNSDWNMRLRYDGNAIFLTLEVTRSETDWSMETDIECESVKNQKKSHTISKNENTVELFRMTYTDLKPYLVNGHLNVTLNIKILSILPIIKKLRNFDDDVAKETSDVLLIIENQKFYVSKLFLAAHSSYFKSLFLGNFEESKKSEIELKDIDPIDFQHFLELIYGESNVQDETVEGILAIADFVDAKTAFRRCEDFLMTSSKNSKKFGLAIKYKMDNLKNKCLSEMKNSDDVRGILPEISDYIEHPVYKELLEKVLSFKESSSKMVYTRKCQKKTENDEELLGKLKAAMTAETEEIKNSQKRKFDEFAEKLQSMEKSIAKIPKLDEKSKSSKKFVLKHVFENVANLKVGDCVCSGKEDHSIAKWYMQIMRNETHLEFYVFCVPIAPVGDGWSIEAKLELRVMGNDENTVIKTMKRCFNHGVKWGYNKLLKWEDIKNYDKLTAKVKVEILKKTGFENEKSRLFDESQEEVSDVILVVQSTKFYVQKMYLALHSSYFKALFFGKFDESQKNEIELKDIDPDDFQNFLELIHGESSVGDDTVSGILQLAEMYDAPTAIRRCEEFLLKNSQKTMPQKLQISLKYNLRNLKSKCLSEVTTISDIQSIVASKFKEMDLSTMETLLQKSLEFSNK